jgi:diguanylate cyclase (GGDEF)-like protein
LLDLVADSDRRGAESLLHSLRSDPKRPSTSNSADWSIRKVDGSYALTEVTCRDLRDKESVRGIVVTLRDVTDQRRLERELTRWAFHDALTGLPNRRFFDERVAQAVATDRGITGVVAVDLDNFKLVNDGLGHGSGDAALRITADRLRDASNDNGFAARLGGDEFAVLVQNLPDADAANAVAARICETLAQPMTIDGSHISCSASVGVATTAEIGEEGLLRHADLALYAAKEAGHGNWRRYEPAMTHAVVHRLDMHSSLGRAMDNDELMLDYQPIVGFADRRTVGFEALVRWDHPTRGRLMPGAFIGVAEEAGLIFALGRWVLARAMTAAARWSGTGRQNEPYVAVNVSPLQFRWPGFVDDVYSLCEANDLPPYRLMLEITESLLLRDDEEVWQDLERLRRWGVRIAIDDFGTGYSALSYLRQVPLDVVKLDRLFTNTMTSSSRQRKLVEGIVRLARAMDLKVVAEGVETEAERNVAAAVGCAYGQGYLFARPMAEAAIDGWLAEQADAARSPRSMRGRQTVSQRRISNLGSARG